MDHHSHPSERELRRFAAGELTRAEGARVVGHLLRRCPRCAATLRGELFPAQGGGDPYGPAVRRAARRARRSFEEERAGGAARREAGHLVAALEAGGAPEAPRAADPRLIDRLVQAARERLSSDIACAVAICELVVGVADRLDPDAIGERRVADLRARARVELAKARRRAGDLWEADLLLRQARPFGKRGSGAAEEEGGYWEEVGLLRTDQNRFGHAAAAFERALGIHERADDLHSGGRVLACKAMAASLAGEPEAAIRLLNQAAGLIDPEREPRWVLSIYHNLGLYHAEAGMPRDALTYLADAEPLYRKLGKPADLHRLQWTRAKILMQEGRLREAEEEFRSAREGFRALDLAYEGAVCSLDLAAGLVEQGRTGELPGLVAEMLPFFRSRRIGRETLSALLLFRRAVEAEEATVQLIRSVASAVRRRRA